MFDWVSHSQAQALVARLDARMNVTQPSTCIDGMFGFGLTRAWHTFDVVGDRRPSVSESIPLSSKPARTGPSIKVLINAARSHSSAVRRVSPPRFLGVFRTTFQFNACLSATFPLVSLLGLQHLVWS
jgi:hypothetical protein